MQGTNQAVRKGRYLHTSIFKYAHASMTRTKEDKRFVVNGNSETCDLQWQVMSPTQCLGVGGVHPEFPHTKRVATRQLDSARCLHRIQDVRRILLPSRQCSAYQRLPWLRSPRQSHRESAQRTLVLITARVLILANHRDFLRSVFRR